MARLSDVDRKSLADDLKAGAQYRDVVQKYGVGINTARRIAEVYGVPRRLGEWTEERELMAISLYEDGLSMLQIAKKLKTNPCHVASALEKHRTQKRDRGWWVKRSKWTNKLDSQVAEWYLSGLNMKSIADSIGSSSGRVRESLLRSGIQSRKRHQFLSGKSNPSWNGGRTIDKGGYVLVRCVWHPNANRSGYVREHRLVVECILGRFLTSLEVVHHRNSVRDDNRPENLQLYGTNADHLRDELTGRVPKWTEVGLRNLRQSALKRREQSAIRRKKIEIDACP